MKCLRGPTDSYISSLLVHACLSVSLKKLDGRKPMVTTLRPEGRLQRLLRWQLALDAARGLRQWKG
jgi:hypothetical protein